MGAHHGTRPHLLSWWRQQNHLDLLAATTILGRSNTLMSLSPSFSASSLPGSPLPGPKPALVQESVLPTLLGEGYGTYRANGSAFVASYAANMLMIALVIWSGHWVVQHHQEIKQHVTNMVIELSPFDPSREGWWRWRRRWRRRQTGSHRRRRAEVRTPADCAADGCSARRKSEADRRSHSGGAAAVASRSQERSAIPTLR